MASYRGHAVYSQTDAIFIIWRLFDWQAKVELQMKSSASLLFAWLVCLAVAAGAHLGAGRFFVRANGEEQAPFGLHALVDPETQAAAFLKSHAADFGKSAERLAAELRLNEARARPHRLADATHSSSMHLRYQQVSR